MSKTVEPSKNGLIEGMQISARVIREEAGGDHVTAVRLDNAIELIRELRNALQLVQGQAWELRDDDFGREIKRRAERAIEKAAE